MIHYKKLPRLLALILTVLLACASIPAAAADSIPKEEVVYGNLAADGTVREINIVNMFDLEQDTTIVDHGDYESLRNMTTTDEIRYSGDTVTIAASAGKLCYEGKLNSLVLPWHIELRYFLDGKELPAEEMAGKSGSLTIQLRVSEESACDSSFFADYALQAAVTLDTSCCRSISAPDATIAHVGSDQQLTYTILPGQGLEAEITAQVTEFHMEGISFNGIPLNLSVEVDDAELMAQVTELLTAIEALDEGAGALRDGVDQVQNSAGAALQTGASDLQSGTDTLYSGVGDLKTGGSALQSGAAALQTGAAQVDAGAQALSQGVSQMQTALEALNQQSPALTEGSAAFRTALGQLQTALGAVSVSSADLTALGSASGEIQAGIDTLVTGTTALQQSVSVAAYKAAMLEQGLDIDGLQAQNDAAITNLQGLIDTLNVQIAAMTEAGADTTSLTAQIGQLESIISLLGANNAGISGTEAYLSGVSENLAALVEGATALQSSYAVFGGQISTLVDTLSGLAGQMEALSAGVNALVTEYETIDSGITSYTGAVAQIVAGYAQISGGAAQLATGSSALKTGTDSLYSGTRELLVGIMTIYNGTGSLKDGTGALNQGVAELLAALVQLNDGAGSLKDGTGALRTETAGMDTEIDQKIDELLRSFSGGDVETVSFVSGKNTDVARVQFVLKTDPIQAEELETASQEEPETKGFWKKLLALFGL